MENDHDKDPALSGLVFANSKIKLNHHVERRF